MKSLWTAVVSAFSTFSVLPTPRIEWNEYSLKNVLAALPLVGVVIGGVLCLCSCTSDSARRCRSTGKRSGL